MNSALLQTCCETIMLQLHLYSKVKGYTSYYTSWAFGIKDLCLSRLASEKNAYIIRSVI